MFTEHLIEIEPGIFENPDAAKPDNKKVADHYKNDCIRILECDKYHYECLARKLDLTPAFAPEYHSVADIAGGHPKLATKLDVCGDIVVYDQYASMYKKLHPEFERRYPTKAKVSYEKKSITHPNFSPNAELAICCHILEHLTLDQIRRLLSNLETDKIIVYGPNIARANNENWFHFKPSDHRTFATVEAMSRLVSEAGFIVLQATQYQEDYLIFGDK